jgi:hypothetical protein
MWNYGKKNSRFTRQIKNIITLVLSEKIFLNETKNHNPPFKLNGRSLRGIDSASISTITVLYWMFELFRQCGVFVFILLLYWWDHLVQLLHILMYDMSVLFSGRKVVNEIFHIIHKLIKNFKLLKLIINCSGVRVTRSLVLCVIFCRLLFVLLSFFFWPLRCLFFFYIRILITSLVSSNSSQHK